jgi:magnesium chelatase family protein
MEYKNKTKVKYGRVMSCALDGIQGTLVEIEVSLLPGLPHFEIVGLGDCAVRESRNRVYAAIRNSHYDFPQGRLTASYAPAWLRKEGTGFDLALALAILIASGQLKPAEIDRPCCVFGELSLTGRVKPLPGVICRAVACLNQGISQIIIPQDNYYEAVEIEGVKSLAVTNLRDAAEIMRCNYLERMQYKNKIPNKIESLNNNLSVNEKNNSLINDDSLTLLSKVSGQKKALRAMLIAASGWHHSLLLGSAGCGKTTLARAVPLLLPDMDHESARSVTMVHSVAGKLPQGSGLIIRRPYESPHHSVTKVAMIGGGTNPKPGLCSLAHKGVLFLDEMTEFQSGVLDCLRQPLESQFIDISRHNYNVRWPADFLLIGAANPCKCGNYLEPELQCRCTVESIRRHLDRISGPLLDRMDLVVEMRRLSVQDLTGTVNRTVNRTISCEPALEARKKVSQSWIKQYERCLNYDLPPMLNGRVDNTNMVKLFEMDDKLLNYAAGFADHLGLSARGYIRVLRLARTISDLDESRLVKKCHVAEALQFRLQKPV